MKHKDNYAILLEAKRVGTFSAAGVGWGGTMV